MSAESEPADKLVGQVLANRYEILHRLGEGAMGAVYKARHVKVGRTFAVKVLHPRLLKDAKVAQRFAREAELAGRLRHANVVGVVDVGELDDMHYMVMDFAEGPDLAQLLVEAPMPPGRIIRLVRQMLEGLYHAHEQGLIHRDFKPENVIVERDTHGNEMPRVVDFGIALLREGGDSTDSAGRLTTNGLVLGTPHYMAPEQAVADPIDHRIDLFALGIVIYEMLSGRLPFDGSGAEVARANLLLDPPPISERVPYLEVDPLLEAFARRLMEKKRERRPATANIARELLDLIERDRRAAGLQLGVAPELSERAPAMTQPVVRQSRFPDPPPSPSTVAMRPTPPPSSVTDARWLAPVESEPLAEPIASPPPPELPAMAARAAGPVWTPGPPILFSAAPEPDRETAMRTPLDWQAAPPPRRRAVWIAASAGVGAIALVVAWLALRTPAEPAPAPAIAAAPPPVVTTPPVVTPAPTPVEPAHVEPTRVEPAPIEPAPITSAPVAKPVVVKPHVDPRKPRPPASPETHAVAPTEPKPAEPKPAEPRPVEIKPAEPKPAEPKPVVARACDTTVPPVEGITANAIAELYSTRVPQAIGALPKDKQSDLWSRLTIYRLNDLMARPQAERENAARALWRIVNDARCRATP